MIRPGRPTLPLSEWPTADRCAWAEATAYGGLLDDGGAAAHHCARSLADFARAYGYLLRFAQERGALDHSSRPTSVVTPDIVDAYVRDLEQRVRSVTRHCYLYRVMRVAEYVAPERDWRWLRRRTQMLAFAAKPRDKRPRVVTSDRIVALGLSLMDSADRECQPRFLTAVGYRDGLLLAFLALCPIRLSNFAGLRLGASIQRLDSAWVVIIPSDESKTGWAYETLLPDLLGERLDRFVETWRLRFPRVSDSLWPSNKGGALSASGIDRVVRSHTQAAFGQPLSPHLFRDCAATTVAIKAGNRMGTAVALLGHRSPQIINKHYNQAGMLDALTRYHDLLTR